MKSFRIAFLKTATILVLCSSGFADVRLPAILSDHAVLQKSAATHIWGKADPGEKIQVSIGKAKASGLTGPNGRWKVSLDLSTSEQGPFDLAVEGKNSLVIHDVVVGEVWLASGQSNMAFTLGGAMNADMEIANSEDVGFRQFAVKEVAADEPKEDAEGVWIVAGPATSRRFTAVGYYFGNSLRRELKVPVGLVAASWGGTQVESWTSLEALDAVPALKSAKEQLRKSIMEFPTKLRTYLDALHSWEQKYDRQTPLPSDVVTYSAPDADTSDWKSITLPGKLSAQGLPDAGVVWLRKTISLSAADAGKRFEVEFVAVPGLRSLYWNGKLIDCITPENPSTHVNHCFIPSELAKEGDNVMVFRLVGPAGNLGVAIPPRRLTSPAETLNATWLAKVERSFPASEEALREYPKQVPALLLPQHHPSALFNGMIHPLLPFTLAGVIWYQGENNTLRAFQYRTSFPLMIQDWRKQWGRCVPFYYCQLANYLPNHLNQGKSLVPEESDWAELREAQTQTLSLPETGQAILIDIGDEANIHPKDKKDVGDRLARIALAKTYNKGIPYSGPVFDHLKIEGNKARLTFRETGKCLVAKPLPADYQPDSRIPQRKPLIRNSPKSELEGFAICGTDQKWVWADAKIDGSTVWVWSGKVTNPVAVRYLWADCPIGNLYNDANLPAGPFRTDDFPAKTSSAVW